MAAAVSRYPSHVVFCLYSSVDVSLWAIHVAFLAREGEIYGRIPIGTNESNVYACVCERNDADGRTRDYVAAGSLDVKCVCEIDVRVDAIEQDRWEIFVSRY